MPEYFDLEILPANTEPLNIVHEFSTAHAFNDNKNGGSRSKHCTHNRMSNICFVDLT